MRVKNFDRLIKWVGLGLTYIVLYTCIHELNSTEDIRAVNFLHDLKIRHEPITK
jgi:hypothetical protein